VSHFILTWAFVFCPWSSYLPNHFLNRNQNTCTDSQMGHSRTNDVLRKRITGTILNVDNLRMLGGRRGFFYLLSLILHNTKPVGHQVTLPFSQL
jgi:hypothetical protein